MKILATQRAEIFRPLFDLYLKNILIVLFLFYIDIAK